MDIDAEIWCYRLFLSSYFNQNWNCSTHTPKFPKY